MWQWGLQTVPIQPSNWPALQTASCSPVQATAYLSTYRNLPQPTVTYSHYTARIPVIEPQLRTSHTAARPLSDFVLSCVLQ